MQTEIRHKPAFATLFTTLEPGDSIIAESDAMASMTSNTSLTAKFNGGFLTALLLKFLGAESLFVNLFKSGNSENAEVVLTSNTPGDMIAVELND